MRQAVLSAIALLLVAAPVAAQAPAPARAPRVLEVLTAEDVDPARLLPPPPAADSEAQKRDLELTERAYRTRTPERLAQADWDDKHEDSGIFAATLGPGFDLDKLKAVARLLKLVEHDQSVAANIAKRYFLRDRPWAVDPSIKPCDYKPGAAPKTSYPSGHATLGYSVGYVLAQLVPEKAQAIQARASDYAYSRTVCGDHFPSDLEASHVLGVTIGVKFLSKPAMQTLIAEARSELKAASLTQ